MADKKISALTAATTPLAGTEVLPIVQSGSTVKVANNDLRPKQIQSNATSGVLQVVGPAAAATRVMTVPDANFTAARTDAAQSFTGDQTLGTGNLIQGTAAKGINFTANSAAAGMTSQLLNVYEEGTWTPVLGGVSGTSGQTYDIQAGYYVKIGRLVFCSFRIVLTAKGTITGNAQIQGLPFTSKNANGAQTKMSISVWTTATGYYQIFGSLGINATAADLYGITSAQTNSIAVPLATADINNSTQLVGTVSYYAST